jgi:hypothetical protein
MCGAMVTPESRMISRRRVLAGSIASVGAAALASVGLKEASEAIQWYLT